VTPVPYHTYQLAGLDPRERGFSRPVQVVADGTQYRAILRYENTCVSGDPATSHDSALERLIASLHDQGYRQLKSQMSFRDGTYLGSRDPWTEYADPPPSQPTLFAALRSWFHRHRVSACA
jgi:hypothetical protein